MNCYIKNKKTFKTLCVCSILDYSLTLCSIYDEISTITILRERELSFSEGDFIVAGKYIGILKETVIDKLRVELRCEHIVKLFARDLLLDSGVMKQSAEAYLKSKIDGNYTAVSDEMYRLPFLRVETNSATTSVMRPDAENGIWNIKSFISKTRRILGVFTEFSASKAELLVTLQYKKNAMKQIDLSNPAIKILEETYSNQSIGKITSACEENGAVVDWYLLENGNITNKPNANRVQGDWIILPVEKAEDVQYNVQDEFAKNSYSHKLLFSMPLENARFEFYDKVKIAAKGKIYYSYIAAIRVNKDSTRIEYQCGELRTSFTDKIQEEL